MNSERLQDYRREQQRQELLRRQAELRRDYWARKAWKFSDYPGGASVDS